MSHSNTCMLKVEREVAVILGRDQADWRVQNACPPCTYKLEDEPHLQRMVAMDGNNSLKCIHQIGTYSVADQRVFGESDYFLLHEYVNQYANEVKAKKKALADPDNTEADNQAATEPIHPNSLDDPDPAKDANLERGGDRSH
ncbi:hypothetical protein B0H34DRAFT_676912 [Crassisporium funariophilum]|nr:hypothetical protein B0H34DRAFT_676912 [Crassisporium funariophilum]